MLERLERRKAALQPSSRSRRAAWRGSKIAGALGRGGDSSVSPSIGLCSRCRGGFGDPLRRRWGRAAEPGLGCSAAAGRAWVLVAEPACCRGRR